MKAACILNTYTYNDTNYGVVFIRQNNASAFVHMESILLLFNTVMPGYNSLVFLQQFNLFCCVSANCTAGQYSDVDQIVCRSCERGTYQSKQMQTSCVDCPSGQTTLGEASTAVSDCVGECTI